MSNSESELTHASILQEARAARDGLWIEKILAQVRESMCGTGFTDQKDILEKLKTLPNPVPHHIRHGSSPSTS